MMIEVVVRHTHEYLSNKMHTPPKQPFFHIMATRIAQDIGDNKQDEIVATTLVAFAFSSVLTGMAYHRRR
jgi:hypothetical protein